MKSMTSTVALTLIATIFAHTSNASADKSFRACDPTIPQDWIILQNHGGIQADVKYRRCDKLVRVESCQAPRTAGTAPTSEVMKDLVERAKQIARIECRSAIGLLSERDAARMICSFDKFDSIHEELKLKLSCHLDVMHEGTESERIQWSTFRADLRSEVPIATQIRTTSAMRAAAQSNFQRAESILREQRACLGSYRVLSAYLRSNPDCAFEVKRYNKSLTDIERRTLGIYNESDDAEIRLTWSERLVRTCERSLKECTNLFD